MMNIRRRSIPEKLRKAMSETIAERVAVLPQTVSARNVHLYLSISQSSEVSTAPLVERLDALAKKMSVPVVREGGLVSAVYRKGDPLRTAAFGQPEPVNVVPSEESEIDIVLMPLLAFDANGYRIGYGKSFYDRFLGRLAKQGILPLRIGLAFRAQMVENVPVDSWDEPLDGVIHESGTVMFR
ncbi:MAG: 5-formyltetrahydrofolate cyclo-ligase [Chlorobiaceae bacterium]|nr:5-formyltetrahydrofolate cyclo-ligase [Chlorobiaceae bacterium]